MLFSLLYGAEDPSIAGMVLDSAFANLFDLMMELVDVYKIRLPKFTVWICLSFVLPLPVGSSSHSSLHQKNLYIVLSIDISVTFAICWC